jgi:hypothetical protein
MLDRLRPKRFDDGVFGTLHFVKAKNGSRSYWEGRGLFEPSGTIVEYTIEGDESGPRKAQHEMFRRLVAKYQDLYLAALPLLERAYEEHCDPNRSVEFRVDSLSIPREESEDMLWEIWFSCNKSEDWLFTVHMRNWHPTGRISVMH